MNDKDNELLKQAWKEASPPPVSPGEWGAIWARLAASPHSFQASRSRPRWGYAVAFAMVFLAGVGVGLWGAFLAGARGGASAPSFEQPAVIEEGQGTSGGGRPTLALLSPDPVSDGIDIEMLGLRNVKVETVERTAAGTRHYRMTALTPRGVKVVWNYPAEAPASHSLNGGQS